jgi:hypothetical protein
VFEVFVAIAVLISLFMLRRQWGELKHLNSEIATRGIRESGDNMVALREQRSATKKTLVVYVFLLVGITAIWWIF